MSCAFCGADAIVLSDAGLCGGCFDRFEVDAVDVVTRSHGADLVTEVPAVREDWSW